MRVKEYNRTAVVAYAQKWANLRNPKYYNFDPVGGDCTSFASQCIYAGSLIMNYDTYGWYYINGNMKSASWSGVEFLYEFLTKNKGVGPFGKEVSSLNEIIIGDIIQLSFDGTHFGHTLTVTANKSEKEKLVSAHTYDVFNKPLEQYIYQKARYIHIEGVRIW